MKYKVCTACGKRVRATQPTCWRCKGTTFGEPDLEIHAPVPMSGDLSLGGPTRHYPTDAVRGPKFPRAAIGCLTVIFLPLLIVLALSMSGTLWDYLTPPPGLPPGARQPDVVDQPAVEPNALEISAADLVAAYDANEVAADRRFKGVALLVSGTVETIGKDLTDTPYVTLGTRHAFRNVQASFSKADESQLAALRKGQYVRIQGRCRGMFGNIQLSAAVLR